MPENGLLIIGLVNCGLLGYIGPGAGFAISFSFLAFLGMILGVFIILILSPISMLWALIRGGRKQFPHVYRKVVVLGLDGLDPRIAKDLMGEGKLPNLTALAKDGHFSQLQTTVPAMSPSAWSSFATGNDPSKHNIYDFITRDLSTYQPRLSSSEIVDGRKKLQIGKYRIPLSKPQVRMLRKGVPFWHVLGKHGFEVTILREPITYDQMNFGNLD